MLKLDDESNIATGSWVKFLGDPQCHLKKMYVSPDLRGHVRLTHSFNAKSFFSRNKNSDDIGALVTTSPIDEAFYILATGWSDCSSTHTYGSQSYNVSVKIEYDVLYSEPKDITSAFSGTLVQPVL